MYIHYAVLSYVVDIFKISFFNQFNFYFTETKVKLMMVTHVR